MTRSKKKSKGKMADGNASNTMSNTPSNKRNNDDRSPMETSTPTKKINLNDTPPVVSHDDTSNSTPISDTTFDSVDLQTPMPTREATAAEWEMFLVSEFRKLSKEMKDISTKHHTLSTKVDKTMLDHDKKTDELLQKMNNTIVQLTNENVVIKDENRSLKERLIKLEYHHGCNNLVFDGFPEQCNETDTDCYNLVHDALSHLFSDDNTPGGQSKIDKTNNITINYAHRNGRFIPGRNRSIIINLQWYGDKEYVISNR